MQEASGRLECGLEAFLHEHQQLVSSPRSPWTRHAVPGEPQSAASAVQP